MNCISVGMMNLSQDWRGGEGLWPHFEGHCRCSRQRRASGDGLWTPAVRTPNLAARNAILGPDGALLPA